MNDYCPGENRSREEDVVGAQRGLPEGLAGEPTGRGKQNSSQRHLPGHIQESLEVRESKYKVGEHIILNCKSATVKNLFRSSFIICFKISLLKFVPFNLVKSLHSSKSRSFPKSPTSLYIYEALKNK